MNSTFKSDAEDILSIHTVFHYALKLVKKPLIIALLITPLRFFLEFLGLPENAIFIVGLLWFTIGFAIYLGIILHNLKYAYFTLILTLVIFSPLSRVPVAILWWLDNKFDLGTHYGLYFDTFQQAILNQVFYGSLVQLIPGCLLGLITIRIMQYRNQSIN